MGFRKGAYCTVWEIQPVKDTMTKARISMSKKNKQTGLYETDFSGWVTFVGTASAGKAMGLKEKDRIQLGDVDVTTKYDAEKKMQYINYWIYDFELQDGRSQTVQATIQTPEQPRDTSFLDVGDGEVDDELLPF